MVCDTPRLALCDHSGCPGLVARHAFRRCRVGCSNDELAAYGHGVVRRACPVSLWSGPACRCVESVGRGQAQDPVGKADTATRSGCARWRICHVDPQLLLGDNRACGGICHRGCDDAVSIYRGHHGGQYRLNGYRPDRCLRRHRVVAGYGGSGFCHAVHRAPRRCSTVRCDADGTWAGLFWYGCHG